jgi:hypothetical protein
MMKCAPNPGLGRIDTGNTSICPWVNILEIRDILPIIGRDTSGKNTELFQNNAGVFPDIFLLGPMYN